MANKLGVLEGVGVLLLNGEVIAKAKYDISVNYDAGGLSLAFGWMRVSKHAIPLVEQSDSRYVLRLDDSEWLELALDGTNEDIINFDVTEEKSLSRCCAIICSELVAS
jgi:hypothetical protein